MGKKDNYSRQIDSTGLTEKERAALDLFYRGSPDTRMNEIESIKKAGYLFEGDFAERNAKKEFGRISRKNESKVYVQKLLNEMENELVYDKVYILQWYKKLLEDNTTPPTVKKGCLDSMAKTVKLFDEGGGGNVGDPGEKIKRRFDARLKAKKDDPKVIEGNFYKEGTNEG